MLSSIAGMLFRSSMIGLLLVIGFGLVGLGATGETPIAQATLRIHAGQPATWQIPRNLTGKFCEHLGANIYNGMDAQILRNPTFAEYPFWTGQMTPDGITSFHFEREKIAEELRRQALRSGWPEADLSELGTARNDGLAAFWSRAGSRDASKVSPDTGPQGGRAQRIEIMAGAGIKQWTWLPLRRTHQYTFELLARSVDLRRLKLSITREGSPTASGRAWIEGLAGEWRKISGTVGLANDTPSDRPYCVTLSSDTAGQVVLGHFFLWPEDNIHGADPDVIGHLKATHLPLLRWPGGNFVSAYHWQDGVGPIESRPTLPNYAWGGVEPNTFGTDEFIAFCRAVGCEPMICINAGTGTPEEAAQWVQYCNGVSNSPMGALRAANGHADPFGVRHWEVGNELWGQWQAHWTTAKGYVDRFERFAKAMRESDPSIELHACGAPVLWGKAWNDTLIAGSRGLLRSITDHPLVGGDLPEDTDPFDVYRDFMHVPDILERKWGELRDDMKHNGINDPRLAVTELQMFAHLRPATGRAGHPRLTRENLVNPGTLGEALYDTLIYHAAVRLQPFVELITHSATVNHGGGLRKERERVYANPCYHANQLFAEFAGATPLKTDLDSPSERAPMLLPDIRKVGGDAAFGAVDAVAARAVNGDLLVSLVHRGTSGPLRLEISWDGFSGDVIAQTLTLSGSAPWAINTLEAPEAVKPESGQVEVRANSMTLALQAFSLVQARVARR
jgi:alpha-N-arabinofuranosidase